MRGYFSTLATYPAELLHGGQGTSPKYLPQEQTFMSKLRLN